jgi:hypothetical protein
MFIINDMSLYCEILSNNINLYSFHLDDKKNILLTLLELTLLEKNIFMSYTNNDTELSIFCDQILDKYIDKNIYYTVLKNYRCIRIYDTTDNINNIGIVSKISTLLKENNIPILYINSFNNNYILFEHHYINKIINIITNSNFILL